MNSRLTYKEISMVIGILVAILVSLTLWILPSRESKDASVDKKKTILPFVQASKIDLASFPRLF